MTDPNYAITYKALTAMFAPKNAAKPASGVAPMSADWGSLQRGHVMLVRLLATAGSGSVAKRRSSGRVTVQALREEKIVRNRFTSRVGSGRQTAGKAQQAGALFGGREPSC
jgi:hypothetical protein